jgi:hypothetical protein
VKGDFENELGALHVHMMAKVKSILVPFLASTSSDNVSKAHNMLSLILDLWFKPLNVVKVFVGRQK